METTTITQEVSRHGAPHEVFEAFVDEKQHAAFTGLPAGDRASQIKGRKAAGQAADWQQPEEGRTD